MNPVGAAVSQAIEALYVLLLNGKADSDVGAILDEIVRVRAVQDFSPSEAIGFVLYFKQAVREELADEIQSGGLFSELSALETRLDQVLLEAFDVYMKSREKIYQIRANDLKRKSYLALRKMDSDPAGSGALE